jgi:hypothetical protein
MGSMVERVWAIEDCRHVSGRLERCLIGQGERLVRVPPKLMGQSRRGERRPGKSDDIDAVAVARAALREASSRCPSRSWTSRDGAAAAECITATIWSPSARAIRTGCAGIWSSSTPTSRRRCRREVWTAQSGSNGSPVGSRGCRRRLASGCARRGCGASASSRAPSALWSASCAPRSAHLRPICLAERGVRRAHAATLIGHTAGARALPDRRPLRDAVRRRSRSRLLRPARPRAPHRGGDRQLNCALHRIAVTKARNLPPDPRLPRPQARREARPGPRPYRCLKGHLARRIWRLLLRSDQQPLAPVRPTATVHCNMPTHALALT